MGSHAIARCDGLTSGIGLSLTLGSVGVGSVSSVHLLGMMNCIQYPPPSDWSSDLVVTTGAVMAIFWPLESPDDGLVTTGAVIAIFSACVASSGDRETFSGVPNAPMYLARGRKPLPPPSRENWSLTSTNTSAATEGWYLRISYPPHLRTTCDDDGLCCALSAVARDARVFPPSVVLTWYGGVSTPMRKVPKYTPISTIEPWLCRRGRRSNCVPEQPRSVCHTTRLDLIRLDLISSPC